MSQPSRRPAHQTRSFRPSPAPSSHLLQKERSGLWFTLAARPAAEDRGSLLVRLTGPIRTVTGQCVVGVADRDDLGQQWDLLASEAVGVAGPVVVLMMVPDQGQEVAA